MKNIRNNNGFTLIELLVVIAVIAILAVTTFVSYNSFRQRTQLRITAEEIESAIKLAQSKTLSSLNKNTYGIHFNADSYVTFIGEVYDPLEASNVTFDIGNNLTIDPININGGGQDVVFERLTGRTNTYGEINLKIKNTLQTKIINIGPSGLININ